MPRLIFFALYRRVAYLTRGTRALASTYCSHRARAPSSMAHHKKAPLSLFAPVCSPRVWQNSKQKSNDNSEMKENRIMKTP